MPSPRFVNEIPDFGVTIDGSDMLDVPEHSPANENVDELFETLRAVVERLIRLRPAG